MRGGVLPADARPPLQILLQVFAERRREDERLQLARPDALLAVLGLAFLNCERILRLNDLLAAKSSAGGREYDDRTEDTLTLTCAA